MDKELQQFERLDRINTHPTAWSEDEVRRWRAKPKTNTYKKTKISSVESDIPDQTLWNKALGI